MTRSERTPRDIGEIHDATLSARERAGAARARADAARHRAAAAREAAEKATTEYARAAQRRVAYLHAGLALSYEADARALHALREEPSGT
jgi:hypothetical protein